MVGRWLRIFAGYMQYVNELNFNLQVVLFDINSLWGYYSDWAKELYQTAGIGVPNHDSESKQAILFGFIVAWFLGEVSFSSCLLIRIYSM